MKWFNTLPNASINTWDDMENYFMKKWGDKRDYGYILTEFNAMKKKHNEDVSEFMRFNKLYNRLPTEIKPPQVATKVVFLGAYQLHFEFTPREINSFTLDQIQTHALEFEQNFTSTRKWKGKVEYDDRRRGKEEIESLAHVKKTQKHKLEEMNKMLRNFCNKLVKMELDNNNCT